MGEWTDVVAHVLLEGFRAPGAEPGRCWGCFPQAESQVHRFLLAEDAGVASRP
jgi:hypothetical protein